MKIRELVYSRRGLGLALISLSAAATLYWYLRRRRSIESKTPKRSSSKSVKSQPVTPVKSKSDNSPALTKAAASPKDVPPQTLKKTDVSSLATAVSTSTSPKAETPKPLKVDTPVVPETLKVVEPVKRPVDDDFVDRVKTPLPVRIRPSEPSKSLPKGKDAESPSTRSVGELVDDQVPSKAVVTELATPTSPVVALVVTPVVLASPVAEPPPPDSLSRVSPVPLEPAPVSPPPIIVGPPVPVSVAPESSTTSPVTPESPTPAGPTTSADALSAQSHATVSVVSPSVVTTSYQPRTMCDCRVSRDLDKMLDDNDMLFDEKTTRFIPTPTFVFPISFDRHSPQNLTEITDDLQNSHISMNAQKRSTSAQAESILTAFRPILNSLIYANKHAHVINELATNYQYLE